MTLDSNERRALAARAHGVKSKIAVGKAGLTPALVAEIRSRLEREELVKVRLGPGHAEEADELCRRIAAEASCELVGRMGFVATFFRPTAEQG